MTDFSHLVTDDLRTLDGSDNGGTPYDVLFLEITDDDVSLFTRTIYGNDGTTFDVWHGRTRQFSLVSAEGSQGLHLDLDAMRADLAEGGRLAILIDRIQAGLDCEWDGSNMRGTLTPDARETDDEIEDMSYRDGFSSWIDDSWSTWNAGEWLQSAAHEITAGMSNEDLAKWVKSATNDAKSERVRLIGSVSEWANEVRDEKIEDAKE